MVVETYATAESYGENIQCGDGISVPVHTGGGIWEEILGRRNNPLVPLDKGMKKTWIPVFFYEKTGMTILFFDGTLGEMNKKFVVKNDGFPCVVCGEINPPSSGTCRNHCRKCFCSLHVDEHPGDRTSTCGGVMWPINVEVERGEISAVVHQCEKCGKTLPNRLSSDDDREILLDKISQISEARVRKVDKKPL